MFFAFRNSCSKPYQGNLPATDDEASDTAPTVIHEEDIPSLHPADNITNHNTTPTYTIVENDTLAGKPLLTSSDGFVYTMHKAGVC